MLHKPCSSPPHRSASVGIALALSAFPAQLSRKGWSPEILTSALLLLPGYFHREGGKGRIWSLMCIVEIVRKIILCSYLKCATYGTIAEEQFPGQYVSAPSGSRSNIYLHFSLHSAPIICFSQAISVWTMTRQHPRGRHWHVLCNKMKYMSMGVRQPLPSPSSPPQSKSCRCGQQNKQCLCWLSWFYKQGFVVQLHWLRTLGIGAKQLCTYMLCCLCWAVWLPQTLLLQSFSLWADRGLVTSKMSLHL